MDGKKLIKTLIFIIFFILVVHVLANKFYWYSSIWWLDMPMHFLGGFWLGLAIIYLQPFKNAQFFQYFFKIIFFVLLVGVGWEVFEIVVNDVFARDAFNYLDTISDVFFDLAGGSFAVLYFYKRIMLRQTNIV